MKTVLVRYRTTPERAEENAALIRVVFAELRALAPKNLRYASYRLADGVTFVHIATVEEVGENPLVSLSAFKAFQKDLKSRCVEQPVLSELSAIDSYDPNS